MDATTIESEAESDKCAAPGSVDFQAHEAAKRLLAPADDSDLKERFGDFYNIVRPSVIGYAQARLFYNPLAGRLGDAEDYSQEAIRRFTSNTHWIRSAVEKRNVIPYLCRMVDRRMADDAKQLSHLIDIPSDVTDVNPALPYHSDAQHHKALEIANRIVDRLVQKLPQKQKIYYTLVRIQNCRPADVARQHGVTVQTVCRALELAHEKIEPTIEKMANRLISCSQHKQKP